MTWDLLVARRGLGGGALRPARRLALRLRGGERGGGLRRALLGRRELRGHGARCAWARRVNFSNPAISRKPTEHTLSKEPSYVYSSVPHKCISSNRN